MAGKRLRSCFVSSWNWIRWGVLLLMSLAVILNFTGDGGSAPSLPADASITVYRNFLGTTSAYIGATEAGVFHIEDLSDLGINAYRMWTKMNELEWWDDDDAKDVPAYDCSSIGTPTIQEIKDDQASGFVNVIPWEWWDEQFTGEYYTWSGKSREQVIQECVQHGIMPIVVLRNIDDAGQPNSCAGAWAPDSPLSAADANEWWEHCFAIAYWLNVRHDYGITHFEVLNEPDLSSQGWHGSQAEYVQMVQIANDAVKFANDLAGIDTRVHAPLVANYGSSYISYSLDYADDEIDIVDYHNYDTDPTASVSAVKTTLATHNPDGVSEPIWVSEWGTYSSSYDEFDRAILTAQQLLTFSELGVEGVTIFGMYDWGGFSGLVATDGSKSETYYAYRLMTRGLKGGKDRLQFTTSGLSGDVIVTADDSRAYIIAINGDATILADISDLSPFDQQVKIYEYSSTSKDAVVVTATMSDGQFSFTAPASGIVLAEISLPYHVYFPILNK